MTNMGVLRTIPAFKNQKVVKGGRKSLNLVGRAGFEPATNWLKAKSAECTYVPVFIGCNGHSTGSYYFATTARNASKSARPSQNKTQFRAAIAPHPQCGLAYPPNPLSALQKPPSAGYVQEQSNRPNRSTTYERRHHCILEVAA